MLWVEKWVKFQKYANKIMINDNYLAIDDVFLFVILFSNIWNVFFHYLWHIRDPSEMVKSFPVLDLSPD